MNKKKFDNINSSEERNKILLKGILLKMEDENLSQKELSIVRKLEKLHESSNENNTLSNSQLNRAVKRNRQAILKKKTGKDFDRKSHLNQIYFIVGAVAATVAILLVFTFYNTSKIPTNQSDYEVVQNIDIKHYSTDKEVKRIILPDGSTVFLNRDTKITLQKGSFTAYSREIWLEEGEVFFDIKKDPKRPFVVHTKNGISTRVLGTSFNIKSYSELNNQVISVNSGLVQVTNDRLEKIVLEPNYKVSVSNTDSNFIPGETDAQGISDWRKGEIVLENAPISEVAFRIKQYYGMDVIYDDAKYRNDLIYTCFTTESTIVEIIEVICKLTNSSFSINNSKIFIDK